MRVFLVLLHKSGSKLEHSNYRGTSITSILGKLFNRVINSRLLKFINNMSLISENQIGFKAKNRTADHLFSLKTIIDQYKIKRRRYLLHSLTCVKLLTLSGELAYSINF